MSIRLKPLNEQVIVITGASSGIGLATARLAARRGASVVLVARNEHDLERIVAEIEQDGGRAAYAVADVADAQAVDGVAESAIRAFGRIDCWVNGAAASVYGRLDEIPLADKRRVFDVTFWGLVHGCRSALPHLQVNGGALINIGSVESDRALPLHGIYAAAKHAVKGYTDALRMEIEEAGLPISVTLVKPGSIDTPFFEHSRSYMDAEPAPPPPVYAPDVVAETILRCATEPVRDVYVGGAARMLGSSAWHAPRLTDRVMERTMFDAQKADRAVRGDRRDALYEPMSDGAERGMYPGRVLERSAYTTAALHPRASMLAAVGVGLVLAFGWRALRGDGEHRAD